MIRTRPATQEYLDNWDKVFKKTKTNTLVEALDKKVAEFVDDLRQSPDEEGFHWVVEAPTKAVMNPLNAAPKKKKRKRKPA